ncbi:MAG: phosphoribosylformylglycinamidine synthase [Desulfobulbaceae bacterium]|jgi:phosphoribosylformylglycinamidine synthase|nr:phosphoribosylformylglycinamidine synthase [Desulfobulbaceae bacterium]
MTAIVFQLYKRRDPAFEYCFNIEISRPLTPEEASRLRLIVADGFLADSVSDKPTLVGERVVEVGPRLNFATAWSSNMVSICQATGLDAVSRCERSRRYLVPAGENMADFIARHHDRMTECPYAAPLKSFATGIRPEAVYDVDLIGQGADALLHLPGISMDENDRALYYDYFVNKLGRNPTIVEIMDLNNANSEHSRHGFFKGGHILDGEEQASTLFDLVTATLTANPDGSLIAFKDNSSVIEGFSIETLQATRPGQPSPLLARRIEAHPLLTAETHNFPTGVAPFPGAETGTGGRIRDVQATGRGAQVIAGTAGYCVGGLHIPGYELPWEENLPTPDNLASALNIEIEASNGASDYGNKFGEPLIAGFTRSCDLRLPGFLPDSQTGERWAFLKPIMFTGGIGQMDGRLLDKKQPESGMLIIQIGGPAYRVGFGGGAASSMLQGENTQELDFNAVQRGDAEMEQKMNRVIRACNEMGGKSVIEVIHDQGAGGPANVLKELVEKSGGYVDIRKIRVGDPTMSVLEIYVAEYQERCGLLLRPEHLAAFQAICDREKVACEVLGEVTGDLRFVVRDSADNTTPVAIDLPDLLGKIPRKTFRDQRCAVAAAPLKLPDVSIFAHLERVLRLVSVGSKRFLTNKVDRAVTGLIAQQPCCGPLQLTVADMAVVAQSHLGVTGIASSIGEQAFKMILDPAAGASMAVGEAITNLALAKITSLKRVKCSANWMWAPKLAGEGAALYDAAQAMAEIMKTVGVAVDGGKDSLSMATKVGDETVKSPRQLVISLYAAMLDINEKVTPDLKSPGDHLYFLDLADGKNRLGGSALAQVYGQLGNDCPRADGELLKAGFWLLQEMLAQNLISAGHDRSDGGLITTLLEMAFAGNCGLEINLDSESDAVSALFAEELGMVVACPAAARERLEELLMAARLPFSYVGRSVAEQEIRIAVNGQKVLTAPMPQLRAMWEETSYQLERLQMNAACADEEKAAIFERQSPRYHLPFTPRATDTAILKAANKPKVAILREEGSNSDREMAAAFYLAGFEPWDICMRDLLDGKIGLGGFRGLAAVGGFAYADVPESAKGWAATIRFNERLAAMFTEFYQREDTFTLGVCNGCQLFGLVGWVPELGLAAEKQPRFVHNRSGRFESRWTTVKVGGSRAMMLSGMEGMVFGIHVDHGEGRLLFPDERLRERLAANGQMPMFYADDLGNPTEVYPFNPNGSPGGIAGLCSADGRHLAIMPHPERCFLPWQAHWLPETMKNAPVSPWMKMFQNAFAWCRDGR